MSEVENTFGGKVRVRACGLCFSGDSILLVKHNMGDYALWSPPGGGVNFGESLRECVAREFMEETNLEVHVGQQLFIYEHIRPPLHAIEVYFQIDEWHGSPKKGYEPEIKNKILLDAEFVSPAKLGAIERHELHGILQNCTKPREILENQGLVIP